MLYITLEGSKKRLYINYKAIGKLILALGFIAAYLYISNQDYLTLINK